MVLFEEIEAEMAKTLERIPCSARILSMKGLGVVTVAGLIGEVGDFSKFRTQSEIMKLAGLDLYEISSGKRKGQRRISKTGTEPAPEDPLQRGCRDHTKERDHVRRTMRASSAGAW